MILLILINIPISILYVWFASYLLNTERITIVNNTDNDITDIHIFGVGDNDYITCIEKGSSKTVWVHMTRAGSIQMTSKENGHEKYRMIDGYTGPGGGRHRYHYDISLTEEELKAY